MRLQRVRLQNFRQHADSTIEFNRGLTGIIGPNGAGKSTILEAIAWAVYGSSAARGTNDTIRFSRAQPRAKVIVDLLFELDSHEYRVTRTLNNADLFLDNGITPIATGATGVTAYLQNKLGMTRQEFFNTYFTGQKELQFLASMGPAERSRFLAQVLGYERLRKAQVLASDRRRELKAQIEGLRSGLPDADALVGELKAAELRVKEAKKNLARLIRQRDKLAAEHETLAPRWADAQAARDQARELAHALTRAQQELENVERDLARIAGELDAIKTAEKELHAVQPKLERLTTVATECERLEELARMHERRAALVDHRAQLATDIEQLRVRLEGLKKAPELLKQTTEELTAAVAALTAAEEAAAKLSTAWNRDVQDVKTKLSFELKNQSDVERQLKQLEQTGGSGPCPVCTRPLEEAFDTVHTHLDDELERIKQDINWHRKREQQLATKPAPLMEAEKQVVALRDVVEKKRERVAKCEQAAAHLWERTEELLGKEKTLKQADDLIASVKESYDAALHEQLKQELTELRTVEQIAGVYRHQIGGRLKKLAEQTEAQERAQKARATIAAANKELKTLKFDEAEFEKLGARFHNVSEQLQDAQIAAVRAEDESRAADQAFAAAERAHAAFVEKQARLTTLEYELRHHLEMDTAVAQLRAELNARVRPELGELASAHLSEITDGRYNALEIDDNYNMMVLEDGQEKPVISGGEEDVANLVLRIAISQMIAERAGQHLSTLFLDEVFGSLDMERRDNVIQVLQKLHDRFEQVILITHVETVREGLDHVIRLEYDERTGASVVRNESTHLELPAFV
ncbi:MAG TPA: SMC family ATPase [Longimicrobiales bacterium]